MDHLSPTQVLQALNWRYATKSFDPTRRIPADVWSALEDALVLSPSSFGLQLWKFLVITDQATKEALVPVSWNQRQLAEASHVVVFTAKHPIEPTDVTDHIARTAELRGIEPASLQGFADIVTSFVMRPAGDFDALSWVSRQVYIALGNFMTCAALLGVDTCPMEGIDPAAYDRILGLTGTGFKTLAACPAGYRNPADSYATLPKVRYPKSRVIQTSTLIT
ncbi:MAG: NAD(P)H-dependent oxidoreductase [Terrimicrobiaceae bacterium]